MFIVHDMDIAGSLSVPTICRLNVIQ